MKCQLNENSQGLETTCWSIYNNKKKRIIIIKIGWNKKYNNKVNNNNNNKLIIIIKMGRNKNNMKIKKIKIM